MFLDRLGVTPADRDIPWNIYSATVAKSVIRTLGELTRLVQPANDSHPHLLDPALDPDDPDASVEVIATQQIGKGGESTGPRQGWLIVIVYQVIDGQTQIVQIEAALLSRTEWIVHERRRKGNPSRTAVTIASATQRLRENSVYLDPAHVTRTIRRSAESRRRAGLGRA